MSLKISEKYWKFIILDWIKLIPPLSLEWQAASKKIQAELKLLTDADMLLMIEKGIRGGICNTIHRYAKADKNMSHYDENKESSYLNYRDVYNLHGWVMPPKLPTFRYEWVEDIKNYDEKKWNRLYFWSWH